MPKRSLLFFICGFLVATPFAMAQRPRDDRDAPSRPPEANDLVTRMMRFDKDKDGTLTKDEVTDERLLRLFDRADSNKDGSVTKEELSALAARETSNDRGAPRGRGPGGPDGPGMGPPPRPGQILPPMLQQRLRLTADQRKQLDELQKEVDSKLEKILTDEQKTQLKELPRRGPGGPGGFGPPGGRGRPDDDGPPPPDGRR